MTMHQLSIDTAFAKAEEAYELGRTNSAWQDKHEEVCILRQGQLRSDIGELRRTVRWATGVLLTGMGSTIVTLAALLIKGHLG